MSQRRVHFISAVPADLGRILGCGSIGIMPCLAAFYGAACVQTLVPMVVFIGFPSRRPIMSLFLNNRDIGKLRCSCRIAEILSAGITIPIFLIAVCCAGSCSSTVMFKSIVTCCFGFGVRLTCIIVACFRIADIAGHGFAVRYRRLCVGGTPSCAVKAVLNVGKLGVDSRSVCVVSLQIKRKLKSGSHGCVTIAL